MNVLASDAVLEKPVSPCSGVAGKRVLITGATGFLGSHVAEALVASGAQVRCTVRSSSATHWLDHLAIDQVAIDLGTGQGLIEAVKDVDTVVHLAALTCAPNASRYHTINVEGTRRLAAAARDADVKRFVFVSSLAARGPTPRCLGVEQPDSSYGWSKLLAERYVKALEEYLEVVILRLAAVYGPRDKDMLPLFRMARCGFLVVPRGAHLVQPLYVNDAVTAVLAATANLRATGTFEVAEPKTYSWADVVKLFATAVKRNVRSLRIPPRAFTLLGRSIESTTRLHKSRPLLDVRRARDLAVHTWTADASNVEKALGWSAKTPLLRGLAETAQWYRQQGWL